MQRGNPEEAIAVLKNLTRLDPALRYMHVFQLAACYRRLGRSDEAIVRHKESAQLRPDFFGAPMNLAAIYAELGDLNHAREWLDRMLRIRPDFSISRVPRVGRREVLIANLRKLGLPE